MEFDLHNISERVLSIATTQEIEDAFQRLLMGMPHGLAGTLYVFDLIQQCNVYSSCPIAKILGYEFDYTKNLKSVGSAHLIHPDHLEAVAAHYQRFGSLRGEAVITLDYQMLCPNGNWCWLRSRETALVQAPQGFPLQVMGMVQLLDPHPPYSQADNQIRPIRRLIERVFQQPCPSPGAGVEFVK